MKCYPQILVKERLVSWLETQAFLVHRSVGTVVRAAANYSVGTVVRAAANYHSERFCQPEVCQWACLWNRREGGGGDVHLVG